MHFNIYLDDATGHALQQIAEQSGQSRSALIRHAIGQWIEQQNYPKWPRAVMDFDGLPEMQPFELHRNELPLPSEDPLV